MGEVSGAELVQCRVGSVQARCMDLQRPENPEKPELRSISIHVAVLPALAPSPRPDPLFVFAGGPGQAATEVGPLLAPLLERIRQDRDVVLVDQRGTGSSNGLDCEPEDPDNLQRMLRVVPREGELERCRDTLAQRADLRMYTTPLAMDDLDAVRERLGYDTINLFGASYGTRAALVYVRRHGEHVRSAVLDGVAPVEMALPSHMARDGQAAMMDIAQGCAASPACAEQFPNATARLAALVDALRRDPKTFTLPHPRTGEEQTFTLDGDAVAGIVRGALYSPETAALVPFAVDQAHAGDPSSLVALAVASAGAGDTISLGMFLSVVCAEDATLVADLDLDELTAGTFLGRSMSDVVASACETWPRGSLPPEYFEPVSSDVPVLLLSGKADPATPPFWADKVGPHLSESRHVIVPNVGHGTWNRGCVPRLIGEFLDTADPASLDVGCVEEQTRAPFFVSPSGPEPMEGRP